MFIDYDAGRQGIEFVHVSSFVFNSVSRYEAPNNKLEPLFVVQQAVFIKYAQLLLVKPSI